MDFVFIDLAPGQAAFGVGPFRFVSERPAGAQVAFYVPKFGLSSEKSWAIPAEWRFCDDPFGCGASVPARKLGAEWVSPDRSAFSRVFRDIASRIDDGQLQKAVPAIVETIVLNGAGSFDEGSPFESVLPEGVFRFGYRFGDRGAYGVTPEVLLSLDGSRLTTMALAGTASAAFAASFGRDPKQIREHELVVDSIAERLRPFGQVRIGEREVIEFAQLLHLRTLIEADLPQATEPEELVRAIHPTPAMGVLPRTAETLRVLGEYRSELGVPERFGAPLGVWCGERFHSVAAIRGFFFDGVQGRLPAGCGIIAESNEQKEWDELRLKSAWVKQRVGMA